MRDSLLSRLFVTLHSSWCSAASVTLFCLQWLYDCMAWRNKNNNEQDSPPTWTQEAYRMLSTKYSLWCLVSRGEGPPVLSWSGYPSSVLTWGCPSCPGPGGTWVPPLLPRTGVPPTWDCGTPCLHLGTPLERTLNQSLGYPLERTWDQWKYYGVGYPQRGHGTSVSIIGWRWVTPSGFGQTHTCENSTFLNLRSDAGGNNWFQQRLRTQTCPVWIGLV